MAIMNSVVRRSIGLLLTLVAVLGQAYAGQRFFSMGNCADNAQACDDHLTSAGLAFFAAMLVAILAAPFFGAVIGMLLAYSGAFLGLGIGTLIAALAGNGGLGAWICAAVFLPSALLPGGFVLLTHAAERRFHRRMAASRAAMLAAPPRPEEVVRESGAMGRAVVLTLADTGTTIVDDPVVRFGLRISPDDGSAPFTGTLTERVSRIAVPRPGDLC